MELRRSSPLGTSASIFGVWGVRHGSAARVRPAMGPLLVMLATIRAGRLDRFIDFLEVR